MIHEKIVINKGNTQNYEPPFFIGYSADSRGEQLSRSYVGRTEQEVFEKIKGTRDPYSEGEDVYFEADFLKIKMPLNLGTLFNLPKTVIETNTRSENLIQVETIQELPKSIAIEYNKDSGRFEGWFPQIQLPHRIYGKTREDVLRNMKPCYRRIKLERFNHHYVEVTL